MIKVELRSKPGGCYCNIFTNNNSNHNSNDSNNSENRTSSLNLEKLGNTH